MAVVIFLSPKTWGHSPKARLVGDPAVPGIPGPVAFRPPIARSLALSCGLFGLTSPPWPTVRHVTAAGKLPAPGVENIRNRLPDGHETTGTGAACPGSRRKYADVSFVSWPATLLPCYHLERRASGFASHPFGWFAFFEPRSFFRQNFEILYRKIFQPAQKDSALTHQKKIGASRIRPPPIYVRPFFLAGCPDHEPADIKLSPGFPFPPFPGA